MKFNTHENFININATLLTIEFFFTNTHVIKMRDLKHSYHYYNLMIIQEIITRTQSII